jgi:murein hydrolase activator
MTRARPGLVGLGLACLLSAMARGAFAVPPNQELETLRERIRQTQQELSAAEESHHEAVDALRESERAISEANRVLRDLGRQHEAARAELGDLESRAATAKETVRRELGVLEKSLRHGYVDARIRTLPLLLAGGEPNRALREVQYLGYISRSRADLIQSLRAHLRDLDGLTASLRTKTEELDRIRGEQLSQRQKLQDEQAARRKVAAKLSRKIAAQRADLVTMQRDENRLTRLVEELARMLAKREAERRKRAEVARIEAQRKVARAAAAKRKAESTAQVAAVPAPTASPAQGAAPPGEPAGPVSDAGPPAEVTEDTGPRVAFGRLRGRLPWPVRGELAHRFGSQREDSTLSWKGVFIRAGSGAEVKAVAPGRVVFADWLRGFGNLMILDHGGGYMSLYGNNESLYSQVGDNVVAGQAVATVGNSGGNSETGLYFELRFQSRPLDPMAWVGR